MAKACANSSHCWHRGELGELNPCIGLYASYHLNVNSCLNLTKCHAEFTEFLHGKLHCSVR